MTEWIFSVKGNFLVWKREAINRNEVIRLGNITMLGTYPDYKMKRLKK